MAMNTEQVVLPAQAAAGAVITVPVCVVPQRQAQAAFLIEKLSLTSIVALNGVAANNVTFAWLKNGVAIGGASVTLAAGTNLAANTETEQVPTGGVASVSCVPGDVIALQMTQNGTGLAVPANQVIAKAELV